MKTTFVHDNHKIVILTFGFKHLYLEDGGSSYESLNHWAEHKAPLIFKDDINELLGKRDFIILNKPPVLDKSATRRKRNSDYNSMYICGAWLDSDSIISNDNDAEGSYAFIVWYQDAREGFNLKKTFQKLNVKWEEIAKNHLGF